MKELTGLQIEQKKKIGQLSKGYRQRVGLAQAMIHNPSVLILDEPTSGLDPNQIVEIRNLITTIGKEKTVMLSTHIMQEVEAMCTRVMIVNKGSIVANGKPGELKQQFTSDVLLVVKFNQALNTTQLKELEQLAQIVSKSELEYHLKGPNEETLKETAFNFAVRNKIMLSEMKVTENSLEDIFKNVTTK